MNAHTAFDSIRLEIVFTFSSKARLCDIFSHWIFASKLDFSNSSLLTNASICFNLSTRYDETFVLVESSFSLYIYHYYDWKQ